MTALRVSALALLHLVVFAVVSAVVIRAPAARPAPDPAASLGALLAVSVLTTLVVAFVVRHARWRGWRLAMALFVVLYGVTTVMPQVETAYFVTRLPAGMLPRLFVAGALVAAIWSPLTVRLLGRWRGDDERAPDDRLRLAPSEWTVRLAIIVVAYLVLYFGFGYYLAWRRPEVRAYYGGTDPGSFLLQLRHVVRDTPLLVPFQVLRALLWAALGALVIRMTALDRARTGLAVALLFSVVMCVPLLLPNPFMPYAVRMAHLVETASSNFIFGWVVVLALLRSRAAATAPLAAAAP